MIHDKMCPDPDGRNHDKDCECEFIAAVRADERAEVLDAAVQAVAEIVEAEAELVEAEAVEAEAENMQEQTGDKITPASRRTHWYFRPSNEWRRD